MKIGFVHIPKSAGESITRWAWENHANIIRIQGATKTLKTMFPCRHSVFSHKSASLKTLFETIFKSNENDAKVDSKMVEQFN